MPPLYAFWRYDLFPYFLGGKVTAIRGDGAVETVNYGKGSYFKPVLILPLEAGQQLHERLKRLEQEELEARYEHDKKFRDRLLKVFPVR